MSPTPDRTLLIAPNWIGDAVMAQPLTALLRKQMPRTPIDVVATPQVAAVLEAMPGIDDVIQMPLVRGSLQLRERWQLARQLRARAYRRCYVLPNTLKSAIAPWLARIPERIGHRGEARRPLLTCMHDAGGGKERLMVEHYGMLAFEPGAALPARLPNPVLKSDPDAEDAARRRFGLTSAAAVIVMCPGAEYGPAKRWPARHFATLGNLVERQWPEAEIVLLGSARERGLATEITALSGRRMRNLCGETSLAEAIALIALADGVVSNDSGLMHVAAALDRPLVAVFGSSDPRHTPPMSARAKVRWLHLDCSPCFARSCPLGHTDCLNRITPESVMQALALATRFEPARRPVR